MGWGKQLLESLVLMGPCLGSAVGTVCPCCPCPGQLARLAGKSWVLSGPASPTPSTVSGTRRARVGTPPPSQGAPKVSPHSGSAFCQRPSNAAQNGTSGTQVELGCSAERTPRKVARQDSCVPVSVFPAVCEEVKTHVRSSHPRGCVGVAGASGGFFLSEPWCFLTREATGHGQGARARARASEVDLGPRSPETILHLAEKSVWVPCCRSPVNYRNARLGQHKGKLGVSIRQEGRPTWPLSKGQQCAGCHLRPPSRPLQPHELGHGTRPLCTV